jgi:hypothetical protein
MKRTLQVLNELERGGAMGATFYVEPLTVNSTSIRER